MSRHSKQILRRSQILDAISEPGSEKNDRTVDFMINRLRRKLDDSATEPRFIQTKYGEGCLWVGAAVSTAVNSSDAFAVLGPIRGLDLLGACTNNGNSFARGVFTALKAEMTDDREALWLPGFEPLGTVPDEGPQVSVELVFFRDDAGAECVFSARSHDSNRIVGATPHRSEATQAVLPIWTRSRRPSSGRFWHITGAPGCRTRQPACRFPWPFSILREN